MVTQDPHPTSPPTPSPPILNYLPAPQRRRWPLPFTIIALIAGGTYWRLADWNAYVDDPVRGPWPKFEMPLPWQIGESLVVGALFATATIGALALSRRLFVRRKQEDR
jgi:hypothetical protein